MEMDVLFHVKQYVVVEKHIPLLYSRTARGAARKHASQRKHKIWRTPGMEFKLALLAVKDVEVSKAFYAALFDQQVTLDLGWNVTFSGGFAVQQNFGWLTDVPEAEIAVQPNNMELYFETEDFDGFLARLSAYPNLRYVHPPKRHEWKQRVVRLYDPDGHMIEVGESMAEIARRYLREGYSIEETAKLIHHPAAFVRACAGECGVN